MDSDVARIVARLDEQAATISDVLCTAAQEGVPELPRDDEMSTLMRAAMSDQLHTIFRALLRDIDVTRIAVPATHTEYARVLARRSIPIKAMLRAHRLGQRRLGAVVFAELQAAGMAPETQVTVVESLARTLSKYVDVLSQQALAAYQGEHGLGLTAQRIEREVQIRDVLDDVKSFDVDAVSMAIGYPLSWEHLALVVWYPGRDPAPERLGGLPEFVRALAVAADTDASPLLVGADGAAWWVWLPYRSVPGEAIAHIREFVRVRTDAPNVAIGAMGCGVEGFRRSHRQAQRARTAAQARTSPPGEVVAATDAGIVSAALLYVDVDVDVDVEEIRGWVTDVLGLLASDTEDDARLREILRIYLYFGRPYRVAEELNVPLAAVRYDVRRAVERRGRPIGDKRNVELALIACQRYGSAVLRPLQD